MHRLWCARADRVSNLLTFANGAGFSRAVLFCAPAFPDNDWLRLTGDDRRQVRVFDGAFAMRRLLLAVVMFGALSGAHAADMPDFLRRSLPASSAPTRNWHGWYAACPRPHSRATPNYAPSAFSTT